MAIFAISDLHLSLNTDKPMDVFGGWDNYVEKIEKNWKRIVSPEDTVVIPGDISWEIKLENTVKDFAFINSLPGEKVILKGNHDLWWTTRRKLEMFFEENGFESIKTVYNDCYKVGKYGICGSRGWFYDSGEDDKVIAREVGRIRASVKNAEEKGLVPLFFLHYPPVFGDEVCRPIFDAVTELGIKTVYYGHIHGKGKNFAVSEFEGVKLKLLSSDCIDFTPCLIVK